MTDTINWIEQFEAIGAVWNFCPGGPHAAYEMASVHSDFYLNTDVIAFDEQTLESACRSLLGKAALSTLPNYVVTYQAKIEALRIIAEKTSQILNCKSLCINPLVPNLAINLKLEKVLIITDDIHSGSNLMALYNFLKSSECNILSPILTLANFSGKNKWGDHEVCSLLSRQVNRYQADDCPLCKEASVALHARQHWEQLQGL